MLPKQHRQHKQHCSGFGLEETALLVGDTCRKNRDCHEADELADTIQALLLRELHLGEQLRQRVTKEGARLWASSEGGELENTVQPALAKAPSAAACSRARRSAGCRLSFSEEGSGPRSRLYTNSIHLYTPLVQPTGAQWLVQPWPNGDRARKRQAV